MSRKFHWIVALAAVFPGGAAATTADDLSSRIVIDGRLDEYQDDEWVLDSSGLLVERARDSAWGGDNELGRVALTWDRRYLYVGVECVTLDSRVFLLIDHGPGGAADLRGLGALRREIVFAPVTFRPDLLLEGRPEAVDPAAWRIATGAAERLADDAVTGRFVQSGLDTGALEVAIPWALMPSSGPTVSLVAAITGAIGTGCGDAAPDPHGALGSIRTDPACLDRPLTIEVDAEGDGSPDAGVSPRDVATVEEAPAVTAPDDAALEIALDGRSFAPDDGERVSFRVTGAAGLFVSARVYSRGGVLQRVLYQDEWRASSDPSPDTWDGTDRFGRVVPGGIYIINVSWGAARGERAGTVNAAVAVVR